MDNNKKRVSKMTGELITYLLSMGATDINIAIHDETDGYKISMASNYKENQNEKIENLIKALNSPKKEDIEEYYWELTGETHGGSELHLLGMMVDNVEINVDNSKLEVNLYRHK